MKIISTLRVALQMAGLPPEGARKLAGALKRLKWSFRPSWEPVVWEKAWPDHEAVKQKLLDQYDPKSAYAQETMTFLCVACLEKRLGRGLQVSDFDLGWPINSGIRIGLQVAKQSGECK